MKTLVLAFIGLTVLLGVAVRVQAQAAPAPSYQYQCQLARDPQHPGDPRYNQNLPNGPYACPVDQPNLLPDRYQLFGCPADDGFNKPDICYGSYKGADMACSPRPENATNFYNCYWNSPAHLNLKPMKVLADPPATQQDNNNNNAPSPMPIEGGICPSPSPSPSPGKGKPSPSPTPCHPSPSPSIKATAKPKASSTSSASTKKGPIAMGATGIALLVASLYLAFK